MDQRDQQTQQARRATVARATKETDINVELDLDGQGNVDVTTGIGFFDHMLQAFGKHGLFDLTVQAKGDLEVDGHHTAEDVGIVLGQAFAQALGAKTGITRFASEAVPMDEALVMAAVDISGRGAAFVDVPLPFGMVGDFDTQLVNEFFVAFAMNAGVTLHVRTLCGTNAHHLIEAAFKAVGRVMCAAVALDPRKEGMVPSTKGSL